jgi:DNA-binding beta-propeller fold protein YncE
MLTGGCAHKTREVLPRLLWPPPPAEPRLEFIGTYAAGMPSSTVRGRREARNNPLIRNIPVDLVADTHGSVYLTEKGLRNILVRHPATGSFSLLFKKPPLATPYGIARDDEGLLYLSDQVAGRVLVFTPGGDPVLSISNPQHLSKPTHLTVSQGHDRIFVSDEKTDQVVAFDRRGTYLFSIGGPGSEPGQFRRPRGLALDRQGRLHVADSDNGRIQIFDIDGHFIATLGGKGSPLPLQGPADMDFDSEGHLYVIDETRHALFIVSAEGELLLAVGSGSPTSHSMGFSHPSAIEIDGSDRIYIADCFNGRISVWQYLNPAYLQANPVTTADRERLDRYIAAPQPEGAAVQKPDSLVCFWGLCFDTAPLQEAPQPPQPVPARARPL